MSPLSVVFAGTSAFAVPSLESLVADAAFKVDLVITQPDRPAGRGKVLTPPPVKVTAAQHGLPIWQPIKINEEFLHSPLSTLNSQLLIVVSYGQILSRKILEWPRVAPINVHASLLPRFRGASPIQHAILAGDRETGVTIQRMIEELDAGPILAQERTLIGPRETAVTLHDRLATMGASLLTRTLKEPLCPVEQDPSQVTVCRKLTRADSVADPETSTAEEIDRRVRALTPWPGVTLKMDVHTLKLLGTALFPTPDAHPLLCAGGTTLFLTQVQPPGKKPMSGAAWARGVR